MAGLKELKKRIWFLVLALLVYRLGAHIPVPGLDADKLASLFSSNRAGIFGLFNLFSGGALSRLAVFSLGITPYISASIIIQLLTAVWPPLEQLKKDGHAGRRKLTQYTRYATLFLASFQAFGMARFMASNSVGMGFNYYFIVVVTLVTGTMFLMWLGEQITEKGIGNGTSMLIFSSIVSSLPVSIVNTLERVRQGELSFIGLLALLALLMLLIAAVVFIERGQRRLAVHYARRQQGRKMYAAQTSHLPLKLNMAGPIPPIFASSVILFPATIAQWFGRTGDLGLLGKISTALSPGQPLYIALFAAAVIFFSFFYTNLVFNPKETAENLKKSAGVIAGIRPGEQTAEHIGKVIARLTVFGALYIAVVSLLPEFMVYLMNVPFYFGGTSLLIMVVVVMEFITQVQTYLMSYQYDSLIKKAKLA
jgi:preprotein translocase subunit SecY